MNFVFKKTYARFFTGLLLLALLALQTPAQASLSPVEKKLVKNVKVKEIRRVTEELSSDKYEGRGVLQPGGERAAKWIAEQMKRLGLKPLGDNGTYLQTVPFVETVFTDGTSVKLGGEELKLGTDWAAAGLLKDGRFPTPVPLAFIGYGQKNAERDDIKNHDLKGKIAVIIEGAPAGMTAEQWANSGAVAAAFVNSAQAGAAALIIVANGRETLPRPVLLDFASRRNISNPVDAKQPMPLPVLFVSDAAAEKMFAGSGMTFREALAKAETKEFAPLDLKPQIEIALRSKQTPGDSYNVVGYFEGSDPALKSEAVVFSAHYDAFGLLNGKIYNGAADNAIGNGEMFAAAKAFSKMKPKPKRSLVFISVTAEEAGLQGSKYYGNNPTWDVTKIAANLNLDGIGSEITGPIKRMVGFGADYSTLGTLFADMTKLYGIQVMDDPIPEQRVFQRSDHYAFVQRGIPSLMLLGTSETTPEAFKKSFEMFETTKYHQPSDDVYADWYWPGAKTVADMMTIIGYRLADQKEMPVWLTGNPYSNLKRGDVLPD